MSEIPRCKYCGRYQNNAMQAGSTHCNAPFDIQLHSFPPAPWHPMVSPVDLKTIGKLLEELGEAVSAAARSLIQGIDGCEPSTGEVNRVWLGKELDDVAVNIRLTRERFSIAADLDRQTIKYEQLSLWHEGA